MFVFCGLWCYIMVLPIQISRPDFYSLSGSVPNDETLDQIAQICKERDIVLFSDEMYLLTNNKFDAEKRKPITMVSKYDNAISLFGMSKTFALPGMFTARNSSCGKVMFSQACVCSWGKGPRPFLGGGVGRYPWCQVPSRFYVGGGGWVPTPGHTHPLWDTHPLEYRPHWRYPPPLVYTPPRHTHPLTY